MKAQIKMVLGLTAQEVIEADLASNYYLEESDGVLQPTYNGGLLVVGRDALGDIQTLQYTTGTGKGVYNFGVMRGKVTSVTFDGYRGSFKAGCNVLPYEWWRDSKQDWVLMESKDPERGLWD